MHTCTACNREINFTANDAVPTAGGYVHRDGQACSRARPYYFEASTFYTTDHGDITELRYSGWA
jgi:hypothetical protein